MTRSARRVSPFGHRRLLAAAHASPALFAVYHVLHRHLTPRHPPCALSRFEPVLRRRGHSRRFPRLRAFFVCAYVVVKVLGWGLAPPVTKPKRLFPFAFPDRLTSHVPTSHKNSPVYRAVVCLIRSRDRYTASVLFSFPERHLHQVYSALLLAQCSRF